MSISLQISLGEWVPLQKSFYAVTISVGGPSGVGEVVVGSCLQTVVNFSSLVGKSCQGWEGVGSAITGTVAADSGGL